MVSLKPGLVGEAILIDVKHQAATPKGMRVTARAELLAIYGCTLTFRVQAHDERETVGEGTHPRAIISLEPFLARLQKKTSAAG